MTKRERNMLMVLGGVALAALLFFVFVVMGGDETDPVTAPTQPVSSPPAVPATPGTGVGEPTDEPPRAVTFFGGRDPFVPLINPSPSPGTSPVPNGSPLPTTSPPPDGTDGTDGTDGDPTDGDGIGVTGRPVVLIDVIDESSVQVEVEGEPVTVSEGQRFSGSYEVVSVEASCARFLYGDESFTLCEGEPPK
jgi:hypothetical protein